MVTAFIIESYKRLQPDPNDAILGLLAHIADRLDNATHGTKPVSVSSIIANTGFAPSRSDININIFWFISLVLSLTAALIGIITLQWLREHQRYDTALKPRETMANLNARLDSLERWYVPQIFAGLPLLLQGALVLFFVGMIEFLFALRLEVAVPVTFAVCIPLIFLIATTMLPFLQICILQDAFRLSINNNIPSPCPYKSPQSLIFRRVRLEWIIARHLGYGWHLYSMFTYISFMVAGVYICVIKAACFIRKHTGHECDLPIFHSQRPNLKDRLADSFPLMISHTVQDSGDWGSSDMSWQEIRTIYALSLQLASMDDDDLVGYQEPAIFRCLELPELYDATCSIHKIRYQNRPNADLFSALWECMATLCSEAVEKFQKITNCTQFDDTDDEYAPGQVLLTDLCFSFGRLAGNYQEGRIPLTVAFIKDVICHECWGLSKIQTATETLPIALMACWVHKLPESWHHWMSIDPTTPARQERLANQLLARHFELHPERLLSMNGREASFPWFLLVNVKHSSGGKVIPIYANHDANY